MMTPIFKNPKNVTPALGGNDIFFEKDANLRLNTQNCRGKLTFKVAVAHLALRSPMFGEQTKNKKSQIFYKID